MAEPLVRASMSKDFIAVLEMWKPGAAQRVQDTLPAQTWESIESASRVGWIQLRHHTLLNDATRKILGLPKYQEAWRKAMLRTVEQKTLRAAVSGALRLFGATPASLMKLAPRAWHLLARDAGRLTANIDPEENCGRMTLLDFPVDYFRSETFAEGLVGCIESFLDICDTEGEVILASITLAQGRATYEITWR